jgi:hypothetical protein
MKFTILTGIQDATVDDGPLWNPWPAEENLEAEDTRSEEDNVLISPIDI